MLINVLLLIAGVFFCSTAVIWIKLSTVSPVLLAGLRCIIAAIVLAPLYFRDRRRFPNRPPLRRTLLPGVLLAIHFVTWIAGARMAPAANASLIVNMVPLVMPFILFLMLREKPTRGEIGGTVISLVGLLLLAAGDVELNPRYFQGDLVCLGSMLFFAVYLALARRNSDFPSIWLYVVPLYAIAGVLATTVGAPLAQPLQNGMGREIALVAALAVFPTVLGHSLLNLAMKRMRGQTVALATLGQFIFAGSMAFLLPELAEVPGPQFYPAALLVVAGVVLALRAKKTA